MRQTVAGCEESGADIDAMHQVEPLGRSFASPTEKNGAGIVHQNIDLTESVHGPLDGRFKLLFETDVGYAG